MPWSHRDCKPASGLVSILGPGCCLLSCVVYNVKKQYIIYIRYTQYIKDIHHDTSLQCTASSPKRGQKYVGLKQKILEILPLKIDIFWNRVRKKGKGSLQDGNIYCIISLHRLLHLKQNLILFLKADKTSILKRRGFTLSTASSLSLFGCSI